MSPWFILIFIISSSKNVSISNVFVVLVNYVPPCAHSKRSQWFHENVDKTVSSIRY